jgi:hypothetical protein
MTGYPWLALIGIAIALLFTWLLLIDAVARRRPQGKMLELEAAYRRFSPSGAPPGRNRRRRLALLVLAVLVILNVAWLGLLLSRGPSERAVETTPTRSATPGGGSSTASPPAAAEPRSGPAEREAIQVEDLPDSAKPFETVRIQGTYRGGPDTFLRVQRWEGGKWVAFPLPTKTDQSGQFTAHVELGQPGRYQLRLLDPSSSVMSKTFILVIEG